MGTASAPLTERRYLVPLILVTSLFFLWALGVNLNDILIPHLKKAFGLTDFQSSLIQSAFFGGYFLAALPAGWLMERIGYKRGILIGLIICASGALLFIPASYIRLYGFFLFALFVMACGQSFLEVAANPYVTILGPPESSERRLNIAQSFNAVGAVVTPFIGAAFIFSGIEKYQGAVCRDVARPTAGISSPTKPAWCSVPYLVIAGIFLAVATLIYFSNLPEVSAAGIADGLAETEVKLRDLWAYPHLVKGVIAQFCMSGAQVGVASFVIRFAQHMISEHPRKNPRRTICKCIWSVS